MRAGRWLRSPGAGWGSAALILLLLAAIARADRWKRFERKEYKSANGEHALVVEPDKSCVLDGKAGKLHNLPLQVHVLDGKSAAVLFERYARIGYGDSLAYVVEDRVRWRLKLSALFDARTVATFRRSVSSIWWYRTWWVDEPRKKIVVVTKKNLIREVDLETGKVFASPVSVVLTAIALPHARERALELAAELELKGALVVARPLVADQTLPVGVRLRAALAVQAAGGDRVGAALFEEALKPGRKQEERDFALRAIPGALGRIGIPTLRREALTRESAWAASHALAALGENGAKVLVEIITGDSVRKSSRDYAALALSRLPGGLLSATISRQFAKADTDAADALLYAALNAGVLRLHEMVYPHEKILLRVLEKNTGRVEWLAEHFTLHPSTEAVGPLVRALGRNADYGSRKRKLIRALKASTGLDFGDDVKKWEQWEKRRRKG